MENKTENIKEIIKHILIFILAFAAYFLIFPFFFSYLYALMYKLCPKIFLGKFKLIEENVSFISLFIQDLGALLIIGYFVIKLIKKKKIKEEKEKFFDKETFKQGLTTLGIMYLVNIIISFLISYFVSTSSSGANQENVDNIIKLAPVLSFFSVVVIAPIIEEIIFRYLLVTPFMKKNKYVAITVSALIFGFVHLISSIESNTFLQDLPYLLVYSGMGAVLAYKYVETENIYVSIQGHMFNNLLSYLVSFFI